MERANLALGGAERSVFELSNALSANDLDVHILAASGRAGSENVRILCQQHPGRRTSHTAFEKALKEHLSQNPYDIVHSVLPFGFADVYQPRGGSFAETIIRNAASYENKFAQTCKKITAFTNRRRSILLNAEKRLCKDPNGPLVAALSRYVAEQFKRHYNLDDSRIVVIPNGVKTDREIDPLQADKLRARILAQLRLSEANNPLFFLFVANNFRLKGLGPLIKAMQSIAFRKTQRPAFLIVVGGSRSRRYRHLAKRLNVHDKIVFFGTVRHIQNLLSIIDAAVLPTFYDPASRFILEALAAAKPVITTKFNGAAEMFVNNRHGRVIDDPRNTAALAEAIGYFSNTENIRNASREIVADGLKEKISIRRVADRFTALYDEILEKRRQK